MFLKSRSVPVLSLHFDVSSSHQETTSTGRKGNPAYKLRLKQLVLILYTAFPPLMPFTRELMKVV